MNIDPNLVKAIGIVATAFAIFIIGCFLIGPAMVAITMGAVFFTILVVIVRDVLDGGW